MIHELPNNHLAVEVPEGAFRPYENPKGKFGVMLPGPPGSFYSTHHDLDLPEGNWQMVGKASELTEEQAAAICHARDFGGFNRYTEDYTEDICWANYQTGDSSCRTALESFATLLTSKNLTPETTVILKRI